MKVIIIIFYLDNIKSNICLEIKQHFYFKIFLTVLQKNERDFHYFHSDVSL